MKLKDIATIAVLGVIGFALGMGVGMITGMFGALSMYVSAGFAAFFVGPVYTIMARKVQKRGTAFCFWLIYGVLYAIMGFAVATPLCLIAGIVAEIIAGDYGNKKRVWLSFSASMFIYSMHMIVFVLVLGSDGLATFVESISLEQAQQMVAMYTVDMMVICVLINIVTELLAGRFGMFINDKFFEKGAKESAGICPRSGAVVSRPFGRLAGVLLEAARALCGGMRGRAADPACRHRLCHEHLPGRGGFGGEGLPRRQHRLRPHDDELLEASGEHAQAARSEQSRSRRSHRVALPRRDGRSREGDKARDAGSRAAPEPASSRARLRALLRSPCVQVPARERDARLLRDFERNRSELRKDELPKSLLRSA